MSIFGQPFASANNLDGSTSQPDTPPETPDFELRWECPNCGQHVFGAEPPDLCDFCQDFTTWRCLKPEQD